MSNTPTLTTQRLILRRFDKDDCKAVFRLLSDKNVNRFLPMFNLKSLDEAKEYLQEQYIDTYTFECGYRYAVCLKRDNYPIGYVNISRDNSNDLGYALLKEFWGKGIAAEACNAVLTAAGQTLKFVTATHDINNPASGRVMQKLGMSYKYSYKELWQPKNIMVTFRMYQLNFNKSDKSTYMAYWDRYTEHFIEALNN